MATVDDALGTDAFALAVEAVVEDFFFGVLPATFLV